MKKGKCVDCGWKFSASTSNDMAKIEERHWMETGHRRYKGMVGWGSHTLSVQIPGSRPKLS